MLCLCWRINVSDLSLAVFHCQNSERCTKLISCLPWIYPRIVVVIGIWLRNLDYLEVLSSTNLKLSTNEIKFESHLVKNEASIHFPLTLYRCINIIGNLYIPTSVHVFMKFLQIWRIWTSYQWHFLCICTVLFISFCSHSSTLVDQYVFCLYSIYQLNLVIYLIIDLLIYSLIKFYAYRVSQKRLSTFENS